jgi:hypothetical protein
MTFRNHLEIFKNDFAEDDEAMFQGAEGSCELILCILATENSDLVEVASVIC